jgi:hypothetical protein
MGQNCYEAVCLPTYLFWLKKTQTLYWLRARPFFKMAMSQPCLSSMAITPPGSARLQPVCLMTAGLKFYQASKQADSRVEILSGLKAGDAVVVAGQPNLIDGAKVEIISDPRIAE